jgi:hypothetical protein
MLRKTMIVLLTAAALTGGLTADAFARGGGGGGHGGGGDGGGHGGGFGGGGHMGGGFGGGHMGGGLGGGHIGGGLGGGHFAGHGMALGRALGGLHAEARGHVGRDHFHPGRRFFGFGGGYDDWCSEYPYYTQNCYLYGY